MKYRKKVDYYSSLRHEQDLARKERTFKKEEAGPKEIRRFRFLRIALLPNLPNLLLNNLCFGLTCIPALLFLELALQTGGLIFLAGTWLSMALLFPGLSALYHRSYDYARQVASSIRTPFFSFFGSNFKPCALAGLFLGFFWTLCCLYLLMAQVFMAGSPSFYALILLLLFLCSYYTVMVMVQLSLFDLPLKAVCRNALLLIPSCGWRGLLSALLLFSFILLLFHDSVAWLFLFFLGLPGVLTSLTSWLLWPGLSRILLRDQDSAP